MPILDKNDSAKVKEYEDFVKNSPYTNAMQDMAWAKVKNNWSSEYVYLEENGKITAAVSILGIKAVDDKTLFYAPRGPVCDFYDVETTKKLINEAKPLFEKYNAFLLRMDPCVQTDEALIEKYRAAGYTFRGQGFHPKSYSNPLHEIMLNVEGKTEEELMAGFSTLTRRHIRAGIKAGVVTRWSRSEEDLQTFYELTKIMANRHGIKYRPFEYFERLLAAFPQIEICTCEYEGEPVASMLSFPYKDTLWYIYGATQTMHGKVAPGYTCIWNLILRTKELGLKWFNMGGTYSLSMDEGLYFFKNGFCRANDPFTWIGELDVVVDQDAYKKFVGRWDDLPETKSDADKADAASAGESAKAE